MTVDTRKFTHTFTTGERNLIIFALGLIYPGLIRTETMQLVSPLQYLDLASRLIDQPADSPAKSGTAQAQMILSAPQVSADSPTVSDKPVMGSRTQQVASTGECSGKTQPVSAENSLRDRWAHGRNGNAITEIPKGAETFTVDLQTVKDKPTNGKDRKIVSFTNPDGRGWLEASAWDPELFPYLANRIGQRTTLYITRKEKYLNIVGLRA